MKKIIPLLIILLLIFIFIPSVFAAREFELEVNYPAVGPAGVTPSFGDGPAQWITYLFYFGIVITGIAAVGSLIYAGIIWMTSGVTDKISDAKAQIWAAILGILIVASSVLILRTINPALVSFSNPTLEDVYQSAGDDGNACGNSQYFSTETFRCENRLALNGTCVLDRECQENLYCNRNFGRADKCKPILGKDCNVNAECVDTSKYYCDRGLNDKCALKDISNSSEYIWLDPPVNDRCNDVPGYSEWINVSTAICQEQLGNPPGISYDCCGK